MNTTDIIVVGCLAGIAYLAFGFTLMRYIFLKYGEENLPEDESFIEIWVVRPYQIAFITVLWPFFAPFVTLVSRHREREKRDDNCTGLLHFTLPNE